jgi:hypothetical protein
MGETSPPKEVGQMDREAILPKGGRAKRGIFSRKCSTPMARCYPGDPIYQGNGKIESDGPTIMGILVKRERWRTARMTFQNQRRALLKKQEGKCGLCKQILYADDLMDTHHMNPRHVRGEHSTGNRILIHRWCHHGHHQRHGYKVAEARAV